MFANQQRLDLARRLVAVSDEASHRAAIHAAYYAAFHRCADHLGWDASRKGDARHTDVAEAMQREPPTEDWIRAARRHYVPLLRLRAQADYDNKRPILKARADHAIHMAAAILA